MALFNEKGRLNVSATQIITFSNCQRAWWWEKIQRKKTKWSLALKYGNDFHHCIEKCYELFEKNPDASVKNLKKLLQENTKYNTDIIELVQAGWEKEILSIPKKYRVEHRLALPVGKIGWMTGKVDFYNHDERRIEDHKTVGQWKYALTKEDLKKDIQLMIYSYWLFRKYDEFDNIKIRHNQFYKECADASRYVEDVVHKEEAVEFWKEKVIPAVAKMIVCTKKEHEKDVPCNKDHCPVYGGCAFINFCKK